MIEIVRSVVEPVTPIESEPSNVLFDGFNKLFLFFGWIGVIKSHIAKATKLSRNTEIEADGFGVSDMQIAVGLGRKTCMNSPIVFVCLQVLSNNRSDKIQRGSRIGVIHLDGSFLVNYKRLTFIKSGFNLFNILTMLFNCTSTVPS